jgi:hypothetical protein
MGHFDSKARIEAHLRMLPITTTVFGQRHSWRCRRCQASAWTRDASAFSCIPRSRCSSCLWKTSAGLPRLSSLTRHHLSVRPSRLQATPSRAGPRSSVYPGCRPADLLCPVRRRGAGGQPFSSEADRACGPGAPVRQR